MEGIGIYIWDDFKDKINIEKHKLPLRHAAFVFADPFHYVLEGKIDIRTGEKRYIAIAEVQGNIVCCIYVTRTGRLRIISIMRKSGKLANDYYKRKNRKNLDAS